MEYAFIKWDYKRDENGEMVKICQWEGWNRLAEVGLHETIRETGEFRPEFTVGSFRLRVVDKSAGYRLIVTRDSRWLVPIYRIALRTGKSFEAAWWFFIYILHIWNLADHHPAEIPTWRNIKPLNWLAKKVGK